MLATTPRPVRRWSSTAIALSCRRRRRGPLSAVASVAAARPAATSVYQACMALAAAAIVLGARAGEVRLCDVADAVLHVALSTGPGRQLLAVAMRDPGVDLAFVTREGWVDEQGPPTRASGRSSRTHGDPRVLSTRSRSAAIACRSELAASSVVTAAVERAVAVVSESARLLAGLRAEAHRLERSRQRLLVVDDEQRRLLGRQLLTEVQHPLSRLVLDLGESRAERAQHRAPPLRRARRRRQPPARLVGRRPRARLPRRQPHGARSRGVSPRTSSSARRSTWTSQGCRWRFGRPPTSSAPRRSPTCLTAPPVPAPFPSPAGSRGSTSGGHGARRRSRWRGTHGRDRPRRSRRPGGGTRRDLPRAQPPWAGHHSLRHPAPGVVPCPTVPGLAHSRRVQGSQ